MKLVGENIASEFEVLNQKVGNNKLIYFDNAATTQKPRSVIDAITNYYRTENSNIHRGAHFLSVKATKSFEAARKNIASFINADRDAEVIFTRGTTEAINLVASTYGRANVYKGDNVIVSGMEHHSNIVPWQMLCEEKGAELRVIPVNDLGELEIDKLPALINNNTKILACNFVSNVLGTINPVEEIIKIAHENNVVVLLDSAQATPHIKIDVQKLDCDFLTVSGHKMYGPTGIGCLYGKYELLESMPPYHGGGEMIKTVTFEHTTYNVPPFRFEAGTPNIAGAIGLSAAVDFMNRVGVEDIASHEDELLKHATSKMQEIDEVIFIGQAKNKAGAISWVTKGVHHYDLGTFLNNFGIASRTGHHCAQPLMDRFGVVGTTRVSFAIYNTIEEVDIFVEALKKSIRLLKK